MSYLKTSTESKRMNVAIFPCGSEVGIEIFRALKYSIHFNIIGLNSIDDHGKVVYKNYIGDIPFINDPDFIPKIKSVVIEQKIDYIIPAMDEAAFILKMNEPELDCEIVYQNIETAQILRRKSLMYNSLNQTISVPKTYNKKNITPNDFPLFIKPDIGYGSRGTLKIQSKDDLENISSFENLILSEYLPGKEYTIDCFSDLNSEILFSGVRTRERIRMGISVASRTTQNKELDRWAEKISKRLNMVGAWFFQVKLSADNEFKLLEVASRVSGSMSLYRTLGVNFILLDLFQRQGKPVSISHFIRHSTLLERSLDCTVILNLDYDTVYVDFDDCLIVNESVNSELVHFLYQCINFRKKIILISKHKGDLNQSLKLYRLTEIFDEIIHLTNENDAKWELMSAEKAIFIDDSFAERQMVHQKLNIPVFSPDSILALIEK